MKNDARQLKASISQVTSGGVTALPMRAKACVMPCAKPRLPVGVQLDIARVAVGKVAPSPRPSRMRAMTIEISPPASPVSTVAPAQMKRADRQRSPRAESVADPAADDLKQQIGIRERRKDEADLRVGKAEFLAELNRRGADVDAIDIGDEVHQAQQSEHACRRTTEHGLPLLPTPSDAMVAPIHVQARASYPALTAARKRPDRAPQRMIVGHAFSPAPARRPP